METKEKMSVVKSTYLSKARRNVVVLSFPLVVGLCFAAVFASAVYGRAAAGKPTLTVGVAAGGSFDPASASSATCANRNSSCVLVNEPLVQEVGLSSKFIPGLATSWKFSKGNKVLTLALRHNGKYSTGTPVNAQNVTTWVRHYLKSSPRVAGSQLAHITAVTTIDKWTVRLTSNTPNPAILYPLDQVALASPSCIGTGALVSGSCGAGAYMVAPSQTVINDHYTLVPNPYYYDSSRVHFSKIVLKVIPTSSAMLQALQAGQIQFVSPPGDATTVSSAASSGFKVLTWQSGQHLYGWDVGGKIVKALGDVRVRQALNYAIDRKALAAAFGGPGSQPLSEYRTSNGTDKKYVNYYTYDPAKAKRLLAQAGYANGFTISGADITAFGGDGPSVIPITQAIAKYFAAVGVTLQFTPYATFSEWLTKILNNPGPFASDMGFPSTYPMELVWDSGIKPGTFSNKIGGTGWSDPTLNALYVKGLRTKDPTSTWRAMTDRMTTQADFLFGISTSEYAYASKKLAGLSGPWLDQGVFAK